jgi:hypothetical protein
VSHSRTEYWDDCNQDKREADLEWLTQDWPCEYADNNCHGRRGFYAPDTFLCEYHGTEYLRMGRA